MCSIADLLAAEDDERNSDLHNFTEREVAELICQVASGYRFTHGGLALREAYGHVASTLGLVGVGVRTASDLALEAWAEANDEIRYRHVGSEPRTSGYDDDVDAEAAALIADGFTGSFTDEQLNQRTKAFG